MAFASVVIPGCAEGAGPESILTIVVMDSGLVLRTPRNDEGERVERKQREWIARSPRQGRMNCLSMTGSEHAHNMCTLTVCPLIALQLASQHTAHMRDCDCLNHDNHITHIRVRRRCN